MANFNVPENPELSEELRKLEPTDLAHADTFNPLFEKLFHGTLYLKKLVAGLARVASSGDYEDLKNKPTIPTMPSSLKNPHPWKANGKTYDGSTAQDMGTLGIDYGGTGATTAATARTALGLGTVATQGVANNLTTTAAGYALDARQGKVLKDEVNQINSDLGGNQLIYNESEDAYYIQNAGADTGLKKLGKPKLPNTCTYTISMAVYKQSYGSMGVEKVTSGNCSVIIPWSVLRLMYDRVTISGASNGNGTYTQDTISDISVSWNGSSRSTYEVNLSGTITVTLESL